MESENRIDNDNDELLSKSISDISLSDRSAYEISESDCTDSDFYIEQPSTSSKAVRKVSFFS